MPIKRLSGPQVIARMKRGEPLAQGDYGKASFPDNSQPGVGVIARLVKEDKIIRPGPHIGALYTLGPEATKN